MIDCQGRDRGSDGDRVREIDVVAPPLVSFLHPYAVLEAPRPCAPQHRPRRARDYWPEIAARARYESLRELAAECGVSHETIRAVVRRAG